MEPASISLQERILDNIRREGLVSRKELAETFRVTPGIISRATKALIGKSLIYERKEGKAGKKGGRKPIYLALNSKKGYLLGLDVGSYEIKGVFTDLSEKIIFKKEALTAQEKVPEQIVSFVRDFLSDNGEYHRNLKGIGVGLPGVLDSEKGVVIFSANVSSLNGVNIKQLLGEEFNTLVDVGSGGALSIIGEKYFGGIPEDCTIQSLIWGNGLGLGVLFSGKDIISGREKDSWDFGHITVVKNGIMCRCGKRGCLEAYCGGYALFEKACEEIKKHPKSDLAVIARRNGGIDEKVMIKAAKNGCRLTKSIFEEAAEIVGRNLAFPIQYFAPKILLLTGGVILNASSLVTLPLKEALKENIDVRSYRNIKVMLSRLGKFSGALGGIKLVSHKIFKTPLLHLASA